MLLVVRTPDGDYRKSQPVRLFAALAVGPLGLVAAARATDIPLAVRIAGGIMSAGTVAYNARNFVAIRDGTPTLGFGQELRLLDIGVLAPVKYMLSQSRLLGPALQTFMRLGAFGTVALNLSVFSLNSGRE